MVELTVKKLVVIESPNSVLKLRFVVVIVEASIVELTVKKLVVIESPNSVVKFRFVVVIVEAISVELTVKVFATSLSTVNELTERVLKSAADANI
jgi:hypothetical protein